MSPHAPVERSHFDVRHRHAGVSLFHCFFGPEEKQITVSWMSTSKTRKVARQGETASARCEDIRTVNALITVASRGPNPNRHYLNLTLQSSSRLPLVHVSRTRKEEAMSRTTRNSGLRK